MGHTHYHPLTREIEPETFAAFASDARRLFEATDIPLAGSDGEGEPEATDEIVAFNGVGDDSYESFVLTPGYTAFRFCKTAFRPYDPVVVAVLCAAMQHFGDGIEVGTDASPEEWREGMEFCRQTLGYGEFPYDEDRIREKFTQPYAERYIEDLHRIRAELGMDTETATA